VEAEAATAALDAASHAETQGMASSGVGLSEAGASWVVEEGAGANLSQGLILSTFAVSLVRKCVKAYVLPIYKRQYK
jgi:hypothetical protein